MTSLVWHSTTMWADSLACQTAGPRFLGLLLDSQHTDDRHQYVGDVPSFVGDAFENIAQYI